MYKRTVQTPDKAQGQPGSTEAGPFASLDPDTLIEQVVHYLGRVTRCSASGVLLTNGLRGHITLYRSRPVGDLFLRAVEQRILSIYRVCVGPAAVEPNIARTLLGEAAPGPYEPPRSLLSMPILCEGRVSGMVAVASVFPEAFGSRDLCTLSAVAALASVASSHTPADGHACPHNGGLPVSRSAIPRGRLWNQVSDHLASICDLAVHWRVRGDSDVPEALVQDLSAIADNARHIRELLTC